MSDRPHFFIITPSFNQDQFIGQTLHSVQSQQQVLVTHIVADGGSSDQTVQLLKKNPQLIWWSKKDKGQSHAINLGIEKIFTLIHKSERNNTYFAFLNSDDFYLHDKVLLTVANAFAQHSDAGWLIGDAMIVDENNRVIHQPIRWYKKIFRYIPGILHLMNPFPQPAVFFRWSTIERVGKFSEKLQFTMDYEYWLRVNKKIGAPILINEPLAAFRIHSHSKGKQSFQRQFEEELTVAKEFSPHWLLFFHQLHNQLITFVYSQIKK